MKTLYIGNLLALSALVMFAKAKEGDGGTGGEAGDPAPEGDPTDAEKAAETTEQPVAAAAETAKKSIVPSGWKSKGDELSKFIDGQCTGKEGFEYSAFFELCRKNGLDETKVKHYEGLVAAKVHGIQGRAKMTLRNMLATPARKNGKLIALDGSEVAIAIAKPAVSGAAAKAQETAAEKPAEAPATA